MKKVLILAYDFPPYFSMGAQRPWSWFLYFKKFGFYPIVVTRHWPANVRNAKDFVRSTEQKKIIKEENENGTIIRVPYNTSFGDRLLLNGQLPLIRRFFSLLYSIFEFWLPAFDRKRIIYKTAKNHLISEPVDFIIASGEPFVLFSYANRLSKGANIPWVADYRDAWSDFIKISGESTLIGKIQNAYFQKIEKRIVKNASLISCPGQVTREILNCIFPKKKVILSYNGFFDEEFLTPKTFETSNQFFTIAFGGTIYPFQPLEDFLEGFELFVNNIGEAVKVKVKFFGSELRPEQKSRIFKKPNLTSYFESTENLPRSNYLSEIAKADLLILFSNKGMVSGKLFDYILVKKPVVCIGKDSGEMGDIILNYKLGYLCKTPESLREVLFETYSNWHLKKEMIFNPLFPEKFSRKNQVLLFSNELKLLF